MHSVTKDRRLPDPSQQYSHSNILLSKNVNTASAQTIGGQSEQAPETRGIAVLRKKTKPVKTSKGKDG